MRRASLILAIVVVAVLVWGGVASAFLGTIIAIRAHYVVLGDPAHPSNG